jgi:tetratricopeptide (TPR) repeat protein
VLWAIGSLQRRRGQWDESVATFTQALRLNPRSELYALELGTTCLVLGRYTDAERYLDRAIAIAPDWLQPFYPKGFLYVMRDGDVERFRSVMRDARRRVGMASILADLLPRDGWSFALLGGEFREAVEKLTMRASPVDSTGYYFAKGEVLWWDNKRASARAYFDSARTLLEPKVRRNPRDARAHGFLGVAYAALGRRADAVRSAQRAVELQPVSVNPTVGPEFLQYRVEVEILVGDHAAAVDGLKELLRLPSGLTPAVLRVDPHFEPLRDIPAFRDLVGRP